MAFHGKSRKILFLSIPGARNPEFAETLQAGKGELFLQILKESGTQKPKKKILNKDLV